MVKNKSLEKVLPNIDAAFYKPQIILPNIDEAFYKPFLLSSQKKLNPYAKSFKPVNNGNKENMPKTNKTF